MTNELLTLETIRKLSAGDRGHKDGDLYLMKVHGGYYFDEFMKSRCAVSDQALLNFITARIVRGMKQLSFKTPDAGCSSFTARTADGHHIFARNFDLSPSDICIVFTEKGKHRHATVSSVDLKYLGIPQDKPISGTLAKVNMLAAPYAPMDGMNDAGLCVSVYVCIQGDAQRPTQLRTGKPPISSTTLLRLMLDRCSTVDEAVAVAKRFDMYEGSASSYHYSVTDRSGRSAVLEYIGDKCDTDNDPGGRKLKVTYNTEKPQFVVTNHVLYPEYYTDETRMRGLDRLHILYDALDPAGGIIRDSAAAFELLARVGCRRLGRESVTLHSVVYDMDALTAQWVSNEHFGEKKYTFSFRL